MADWLDWGQQYPREAPLVVAASVSDVQRAMTSAPGAVRTVGAGHSFSPLLTGAGLVLSLDGYQGLVEVDTVNCRAKVRAGSRLHDLTAQLHDYGLGFRNLGDIDVQSIAGATSTATHGTGKELPCLSAEILGLELVLANGEVVRLHANTDPDLLAAARVAMGLLGVITEVEVQLVPAHKLHRRTWSEPIGDLIDSAPQRWSDHRNFEFFYIPFSGYGLAITHDITDAPVRRSAKGDDDKAVHDLRRARTLLGWSTSLRRKVIQREMSRFPAEDSVDYNWRLLASERNVRFREMEYHLPVDSALPVLRQVIDLIERDRRDVFFPMEVRQTAGDDGWLSPFGDGNRISIAVHSYYRDDHQFMFDLLEPIFLAAGGRPHWGKMHSLTAPQLARLYPRYDDFAELRAQWDPQGRFLNAHLAGMFEDVRVGN